MRPEYINILAILASILGWASGIWAVGPRGLWEFPGGVRPYIDGNARAWLYAVVIATTLVAFWHMVMLVDWYLMSLTIKGDLGETRRYAWQAWHTFGELAFTAIHVWARYWREARVDQPATHFGGTGQDAP